MSHTLWPKKNNLSHNCYKLDQNPHSRLPRKQLKSKLYAPEETVSNSRVSKSLTSQIEGTNSPDWISFSKTISVPSSKSKSVHLIDITKQNTIHAFSDWEKPHTATAGQWVGFGFFVFLTNQERAYFENFTLNKSRVPIKHLFFGKDIFISINQSTPANLEKK